MSYTTLIISGVLFFIVLFSSAELYSKSYNRMIASSREEVVVLYASELLEFFRAFHTSENLQNYLRVNPISSSLPAYYFCAHINLLDNASGFFLNEDPVAHLPSSDLSNQFTKVNRYYQVQVIDVTTMAVDTSYCDKPMSTIIPNLGSEVSSSPNLRFLITVGINYSTSQTNSKHLAISTVIPN